MTLAPEKAHTHGASRPAANLTDRVTSFDPADFIVPSGREEEWRFTPLDRLRSLHAAPSDSATDVRVAVDAPAAVRVETVGRDDERLGSTFTPIDRASALAWSGFHQATVVTLPRDVDAGTVTLTITGGAGTTYGHVRIIAEPFAKATVVLDHQGSATASTNVEISVGDSADLTVVTLHDWADDTVHLTHHHHALGRDSRLRSIVVTLGGAVVRMLPTVDYGAPGGDAELSGLFFADAGQHLEHRILVDHSQPNCRSRVTYKGALQGVEQKEARSVWIGDVLIRANALGTDTYELNRNLVLGDHARADSVPNLEIETGEIVGAGHASATGRFDDEQLFYLMSRGISAEEARRLVVRGFFADIIDAIGVPEIRERVRTAVERELGEAEAAA